MQKKQKISIKLILDYIEFRVIDPKSVDFLIVEKEFQKRLVPLYGDQKKALKQIKDKKDRICEVLIYKDKVVGILVYKTKLNNEYSKYGIKDGLEIKTMFVIDEKIKTKGVFGRLLILKSVELALFYRALSIFITGSSGIAESINYILKNGFKISKIFKNKYKKDLDEYLFSTVDYSEVIKKNMKYFSKDLFPLNFSLIKKERFFI